MSIKARLDRIELSAAPPVDWVAFRTAQRIEAEKREDKVLELLQIARQKRDAGEVPSKPPSDMPRLSEKHPYRLNQMVTAAAHRRGVPNPLGEARPPVGVLHAG